MSYTPSNVVQYNEYYPFGMQTANSWTRENTTGNNFLGNGGTELNTTSNLYDLDYRNYDPILGRMNGVDPMATKYASLSPYNFSFNDPVTFNDPSGADPPQTVNYGARNSNWYTSYTYDDRVDNHREMVWIGSGNQRALAFHTGGRNSSLLAPSFQQVMDRFAMIRAASNAGGDPQALMEFGLQYGTQFELWEHGRNYKGPNDAGWVFHHEYYFWKEVDRLGPQNDHVKTYVIGGADLNYQGLSSTTKAIAEGVNGVSYNVTWDNVGGLPDKIVNDIKGNFTSGQKVRIYGYSQGGNIALKVARQLNDLNIPIQILFTVDAADGPFPVDRSIGANVGVNFNFYQTTPSPIFSRGDMNIGPGTIFNVDLTGPEVTHGNIDELMMWYAIRTLR